MSPKETRQAALGRTPAVRALSHALAISLLIPAAGAIAALQGPADTQTAQASKADRKVRLDFVGADVATVVKAISIQSGENVVLMPSVKGSVTVRLIDLSLADALKKVAAAVGADVHRHDNTYFLGSTIEMRAMVAKSGAKQTVTLKYAKASDMKELVEKAYPYLTADTAGASSTIILSGMPEDISQAVEMVRAADAASEVVKPEPSKPVLTREAYTAKYAVAAELADTLHKAVPELKLTVSEKSILMEGTDEVQKQAVKLLAALDVQGTRERVVRAYNLKYLHPHQATFTLKPFFPNLTIQAGFESYTPDKANFEPLSIDAQKAFQSSSGGSSSGGSSSAAGGSGGSAGTAGGGSTGGTLNGPGNRSRTIILAGPKDEVDQATQVLEAQDIQPMQVLIEARMVDVSPQDLKQFGLLYDFSPVTFQETTTNGTSKPGSSFLGGFARTPFGFTATLEAKQQQIEAKILARPNISVIDGEEASMFIGDIIRYERVSSVTENGQQIVTVESIPVGVALLCRPRVNADGKITLRVHPVVSTVSGFTGQRGDLPITSSREADSTVLMKDGETIAISGLLRDEDIKTLTKVPVLGDLPFLGQLFRHRNNSHKKSEVTIFLTAKVQEKL